MEVRPQLPEWLSFLSVRLKEGLPFPGRIRHYITVGFAYAAIVAGLVFSLVNFLQGRPILVYHNVLLALTGFCGLILVWFRLPRIGFTTIALMAGLIFFTSSVLFENGTQYFLIMAIVVSMFMFDSRLARWAMAILLGSLFCMAEISVVSEKQELIVPPVQVGINILLFVFGTIFFLEIYRVVNRNYRKRLEEQHRKLSEQAEILERSNQAKEKIFAILGHDLRSPVASVRSVLDLIGSGDLEKETLADLVDELEQDVENLETMLESLLEWASTQLQKVKPSPEAFSLHAQVEEVLQLQASTARRKGIELINEADKTSWIYADRSQLLAVLRNLVSNGIKFTEKEGSVSVRSTKQDQDWLISVVDTGVGMNSEKLKTVREGRALPASRGTGNEKGFGIGLRICDEFIEANGSVLEILSEPGKGSCFRFSLPEALGHGEA